MRIVVCDKCGETAQLEPIFLGSAVPEGFTTIDRFKNLHLCDKCYEDYDQMQKRFFPKK